MDKPTCMQCRQDGRICDPCFEIACEIIESNRRQFAKLIATGVSHKMANAIMIERIEGGPPS